MFSKHVLRLLSAYCHGELPADQQLRVSNHLESCDRCKRELEEIRLGIAFAQCLPEAVAPDSLWNEIDRSLDAAARVKPRRQSAFSRWRTLAIVNALLLAGLVLGVAFYVLRDSSGPWEVVAEGPVRLGADLIRGKGLIEVGETLETTDDSRATIKVGLIGEVTVEPNTRVSLVEARVKEYRLSLERGRVHANIWAPPRLFFVDTPSAVAVDLGCSYTLEVNDRGEGFLRVTGGMVQLVFNGRESTVPVHAQCATMPGTGPGTPYFEDTSPRLQAALRIIDFESADHPDHSNALSTVLGEAQLHDSLTLWHLLGRVEPQERLQVYERLAEVVPPPPEVTQQGVLELNKEMLSEWFLYVQISWFK